MIIDDESFAEITTCLQRGSLALANASESISKLLDQDPSDEHLWICTLKELTTTNEEMGALGDMLRAVFLANEEGKQNDPIVQ